MAKKKKAAKARKGTWSQNDLKVLKQQFASSLTSDIAAKLGRPVDAVKKKASRMGLRKSKKYMKSLGRS
jgi:hypothetical protein